MFQTFDSKTTPNQGPPRLAALRKRLKKSGFDGFLIPRSDAHQGEYVAPCDERLAWLTGFTGSAGFAAVLPKRAAVFVDGRYRTQVKQQVDTTHFSPVNWPETKLGAWLKDHADGAAIIGFDPWLHTLKEVSEIRKLLSGCDAALEPMSANPIDAIWSDRPHRPAEPISAYPPDFAGVPFETKLADIASDLERAGQEAVVLTLPDSIAWCLNIRGADIAHTPTAQVFAIVFADGTARLFTQPGAAASVEDYLGDRVSLDRYDALTEALATLTGQVRVDPATAPFAVIQAVSEGSATLVHGPDPCILPKATKNAAELTGTTIAHLRDGAAMVEFLAWLDREAPKGKLTEIDVVTALEGFRRATNALHDISFDTICGSGPNGAIVHYRVTNDSNRAVEPGELLLVDSGGQYVDGTTDITRTIATGAPTDDQKAAFTRVLQGMIAISRVRWPRGLAGRDLDPLARAPLWMAGQDYDHGTGHGVGVFLGVHEGPQRISRISDVALQPGMILSNEPGYYREGAFGIRIENLIVVEEAEPLPGGDDRDHLRFRTLTWVPIDTRLVAIAMLSPDERDWLNGYHAEVLELIGPRVADETLAWLKRATAAI